MWMEQDLFVARIFRVYLQSAYVGRESFAFGATGIMDETTHALDDRSVVFLDIPALPNRGRCDCDRVEPRWEFL